jgi:hypothetical protein
MISMPMIQDRQNPADSLQAERLWDAIYLARAGNGTGDVSELEEAACRFYRPMARSIARVVFGESAVETGHAERVAELALARAVLAWRHPTSSGFRRFARSVIIRQLSAP